MKNQSGTAGCFVQPTESPKQLRSLVTSSGQADRECPSVAGQADVGVSVNLDFCPRGVWASGGDAAEVFEPRICYESAIVELHTKWASILT